MNRRGLCCAMMAWAVAAAAMPVCAEEAERPRLRVASKAFTESVILGEIVRFTAEASGGEAEHIAHLGGTRLAWEALVSGDVDLYPDYTGTITQEILANFDIKNDAELRAALAERGITMSRPLGFNNTYVLGMREERAAELGIETISDLAAHPELKIGFSSEFVDRADGWPGLQKAYGLPHQDVRGLNHDLAYQGLESGAIDVTDMYQTDAEIEQYGLRPLVDDRSFFPEYQAVLLYRRELAERAPEVLAGVLRLEDQISAAQMRRLNADAKIRGKTAAAAAAEFVRDEMGLDVTVPADDDVSEFRRVARSIWTHTLQHLFLTSVSLFAAIVVAIPLGIVSAKRRLFGQAVLGTVGIVQTVPSLALFVFLIPLLGIGPGPAIVALFLYSLLGIVRNTYSGLHDIPTPLRESAEALGLPALAQLRLIELPLAARSILAGIKTASVINVGTATLGGFIGAGGYGEPIFTGMTRGDKGMILQGAIPAAIMALAAQGLFEWIERRMVPKGLRLKAGG